MDRTILRPGLRLRLRLLCDFPMFFLFVHQCKTTNDQYGTSQQQTTFFVVAVLPQFWTPCARTPGVRRVGYVSGIQSEASGYGGCKI